MTPVAGLPLKVPVKPGAAAVNVATVPLSVGTASGVTVVEAPPATLVVGYVPNTGTGLEVTETSSVASAKTLPLSVTRKVKIKFEALQLATTLAVTLPLLLYRNAAERDAGTGKAGWR